jgi:hypothetical protein
MRHGLTQSPAHHSPCSPRAAHCREWTPNLKLREWIKKQYALCKPDHLYLCTGSSGENMTLKNQVRRRGAAAGRRRAVWPPASDAQGTAGTRISAQGAALLLRTPWHGH